MEGNKRHVEFFERNFDQKSEVEWKTEEEYNKLRPEEKKEFCVKAFELNLDADPRRAEHEEEMER